MRWSCALAVARPCGIMCGMDSKWARLGHALKAARASQQMEQQDVVAQIGVKRGAVRNIEQGNIAKITPTIRAYARMVGWTEDSVERVLAGHSPIYAEQAASPQAPESQLAPSDLSIRVQQALQQGPLIDSRVTEVITSSGRVKATIVVRGEEGTSQEQLLAALRELKIDVTIRDLS